MNTAFNPAAAGPAPEEFRNYYAAPAASLENDADSWRDAREPVLAGRVARLLAYLADAGISLLAVSPIFVAAMWMKGSGGTAKVGAITLLVLSLVALIALLVRNVQLLSRYGQTIGKRWIGIRIVCTDGSDASLSRILLRRGFIPGLIGGIPYVGPVFALINLLWIFGEEKRCLHDLIADTMVVTD